MDRDCVLKSGEAQNHLDQRRLVQLTKHQNEERTATKRRVGATKGNAAPCTRILCLDIYIYLISGMFSHSVK